MGNYLSEPWRDIPQPGQYSQKRKNNLKFLESFHPKNNEATHVRILLYGPVGAGKSSFVNSVDSVLQERMTDQAPTDAISGSSYTKKYNTYKFRKETGHYSFVFNDIMGLERKKEHGVPVEDIKLALQGHMKDGNEFIPGKSLRKGDLYYKAFPTLDDRVHVLVSVIPADTIEILSDEVVNKMRDIRRTASDLGIPQLAIITKIDKECSQTQGDIKNAYWSLRLKELAENLSEKLGLPLKNLFLVKNYESSPKMNAEMDVLILMALRQMINYGNDYLDKL